jgi:hypothetical protein
MGEAHSQTELEQQISRIRFSEKTPTIVRPRLSPLGLRDLSL